MEQKFTKHAKKQKNVTHNSKKKPQKTINRKRLRNYTNGTISRQRHLKYIPFVKEN